MKKKKKISKELKKISYRKRFFNKLRDPTLDFLRQLNDFESINIILMLLDEDQTTFKMITRQFLVYLVTLVEVFLKDLYILAVDIFNFKFEINNNLIEKKFKITDLQYIIQKDLTLGEIIAEFTNFQNLNNIKKVYSNLFGLDIFEELKKIELPEWVTELEIPSKFYFNLENMINLRHKIIHEKSADIKLSSEDLNSHVLHLTIFGLSISGLVYETFLTKIVKSKEKTGEESKKLLNFIEQSLKNQREELNNKKRIAKRYSLLLTPEYALKFAEINNFLTEFLNSDKPT